MSEVVVFGSAIVDLICYVNRLPKAGETLHGKKFAQGFGGKGANQCVGAARLGAQTALIAKLGDDTWGDSYLDHLRKEGVDVSFIEKVKGENTGIAQIAVADDGENNIIIVVGANNLLCEDDVCAAKKLLTESKVLLCQLETPLLSTLKALRNFNGISILNAAPALENTPVELLQAASIFCVNETEAALTTVMENVTLKTAKSAVNKLISMGANIVIITLGADGAVYANKEDPMKCIHVESPRVEKVVDTTGAGDAFLGSLAFFLARYPFLPMYQIVGAACEIASYSVQYPGTQSSFPNTSQVDINIVDKKYNYKTLS